MLGVSKPTLKLGFPTFDTISLPWFSMILTINHGVWTRLNCPQFWLNCPQFLSGWMIFTNLTPKKNGNLMTPPIQFAHHFERQRSLWGRKKSGGFPCNGKTWYNFVNLGYLTCCVFLVSWRNTIAVEPYLKSGNGRPTVSVKHVNWPFNMRLDHKHPGGFETARAF